MTHLFEAWQSYESGILEHRHLLLMLDFDGSLAPIVSRPADARIPTGTLQTLRAMQDSDEITLAIISGRNVEDVRNLVGLTGIHYFGSHGRQHIDPADHSVVSDLAGQSSHIIEKLCTTLSEKLKDVEGFEVENKTISAAAHYRNVHTSMYPRVHQAVKEAVTAIGSLNFRQGKMVFDIMPQDNIDKGTAATGLVQQVGGLPMYFGDDTTDEDAFRALHEPAITVHVGKPESQTNARFWVSGPEEVAQALQRILATHK